MGQKKGFKHSEKSRKKISKTCKKRGIGKWMLGKKLPKKWRDNIGKGSIGRYWSKEQKEKFGSSRLGKKHPNWKGGKFIEQGYLWIYMPKHSFNRHSYVKNSRLVMEKHLGRYLKSSEQVHHKNSNRLDDRIRNLLLCNNSQHMKIHRKKGIKHWA